MGYYTQETDHQDSKLIAMANLLKRLGNDTAPAKLDAFFHTKNLYVGEKLYWDALTEFDPKVFVVKMDVGWPVSDNTIVKFRYQSIQNPYVEVDGIPRPNMINHWCVMADVEKKLIIDSFDGETKEAGPYGIPVSYATYSRKRFFPAASAKADTREYTVLRGGETIWEIAAKLKLPAEELIEHNDLTPPYQLPEKYVIRLPYRITLPELDEVRYELLDAPRAMHVIKAGGAKKWAFGAMKKWIDATASGFYPQGTNVMITAIAHVPLDEPEKEAAYYMDASALGDYATSGQVKWSNGYIHSDLADGHVDRAAPPPVAQVAVKKQEERFEKKFVEQKLETTLTEGAHAFKESFQPNIPTPCTVFLPDGIGRVDPQTGKRFTWVHDFETRHSDRRIFHLEERTIGGTFEYNDGLYARTQMSIDKGEWYGIPAAYLQSNDDLYNNKDDIATRAVMHKLSWSERTLWIPLGKLISKHKKRTK